MTHPEETLKSSFHYCEPTFYPCKSDSLFSRVQFSFLFSSLAHFTVAPKTTRPPVDGDRLAGNSQPTFSVIFNKRKKTVFSSVWRGRGGHKQTASEQAGKHPSLQTWGQKRPDHSRRAGSGICPSTLPLLWEQQLLQQVCIPVRVLLRAPAATHTPEKINSQQHHSA